VLGPEIIGDPAIRLTSKSCQNRDFNVSLAGILKRSLVLGSKELDFKDTPTYQRLDATRFFSHDYSNRIRESPIRTDSHFLARAGDAEEDDEEEREEHGMNLGDHYEVDGTISWNELFRDIRCDVLVMVFVALDVLLIIYRFSRFYVTLREVLCPNKRPLSSHRTSWTRLQVDSMAFLDPRLVSVGQVPAAFYINPMHALCTSRTLPRPGDTSDPSRTEPLVDRRKLRFLYHLQTSKIPLRSWPVTGYRGSSKQPPKRTWCLYGLSLYIRKVCDGDFLSGILIACVLCLVLSLGVIQLSREDQALNLSWFLRLVESSTTEIARINEYLSSSAEQQTHLMTANSRTLNSMELDNWQRFLHFCTTRKHTFVNVSLTFKYQCR